MADVPAGAATQAAIVTAIGVASNGDTIVVPSGNVSFTSMLTITKSVGLRGQGEGITTFTNNISGGGANSPMVKYQLAADGPLEISDITWDCNGLPGLSFDNQNSGTAPMTQNVIHDCTFFDFGTTGGTAFHAVKAQGYVYGLIYNCTFGDGVICFEFDDRDTAAWERHGGTTQIGTVNCWCMEDCIVDQQTLADVFTYTSNGARLTVRHNSITNGASPGTAMVVDCHGNNELVELEGLRGTIFMDFYSNTWSGRASFQMRGGTMRVHDNTFTDQPFPNSILGVTEEEYCRPGLIGPGYTPAPAGDMIKESHFWNNTGNGSPVDAFIYCDDPGPDQLEEDVDFFNRAPESGDPAFSFPTLPYPHPWREDLAGELNLTNFNATTLTVG